VTLAWLSLLRKYIRNRGDPQVNPRLLSSLPEKRMQKVGAAKGSSDQGRGPTIRRVDDHYER